MKTRSWILGAAATVTGLVAAQAQVNVGYNFGVGSGSLAASSGTPVNFSIGSFSVANTVGSLGTNPNSTAPVSTGYAGASGAFNYDNAAPTGAFNNTSSGYYSVTITPSPGFAVRVSDFDFGALSVTGTTGPVSYALRSSINSFGSDITSGSFTANSTWALNNNTFSAVTGAVGAAVTLRLYTYGNTTVSSGVANINIDDVALTVAAVPEASDCALYGCAAIVGFTWWRRSKKSVKQA